MPTQRCLPCFGRTYHWHQTREWICVHLVRRASLCKNPIKAHLTSMNACASMDVLTDHLLIWLLRKAASFWLLHSAWSSCGTTGEGNDGDSGNFTLPHTTWFSHRS